MDEETAHQTRALAVESHLLEAKVRQANLKQIHAEQSEGAGAAEIRDVAEAFAWVTNPARGHAKPVITAQQSFGDQCEWMW
jgi:hypothetical protein